MTLAEVIRRVRKRPATIGSAAETGPFAAVDRQLNTIAKITTAKLARIGVGK